MKLLIWIFLVTSVPCFAGSIWPEQMPIECGVQLLHDATIRDGSYKSEPDEILAALKADWYAHPDKAAAIFDECDDLGFFYVYVDKRSCQVTKSDFGVSHGICD